MVTHETTADSGAINRKFFFRSGFAIYSFAKLYCLFLPAHMQARKLSKNRGTVGRGDLPAF